MGHLTSLFFLWFNICIIAYIKYLTIWIFISELVNSISTLRKIGTQQVVEDGLLWSVKQQIDVVIL